MYSLKLLTKLALFIYIFSLFPLVIFAAASQIIAYLTDTIGLDQQFCVSARINKLSKTSLYRLRLVLALSGKSN